MVVLVRWENKDETTFLQGTVVTAWSNGCLLFLSQLPDSVPVFPQAMHLLAFFATFAVLEGDAEVADTKGGLGTAPDFRQWLTD